MNGADSIMYGGLLNPGGLDGVLNQDLELSGRTKVLLVHDGSRPFGYEVADLGRAELPASVDLEILTVGDLFLTPLYLTGDDTHDLGYHYDGLPRYYSTGSFTDLDASSREAAQVVKKTFLHWNVRNAISADLAVQAVVEKAARWKPDMVVVGSAGLNWFERGQLRTLLRRLAIDARCSVRAARPGRRADRTANRIMLAFDGSQHSEKALEAVLRRTWPAGSEAYLVSCIEPLISDELCWMDDYVDHHRQRIIASMHRAKRELESVGLKVHFIVEAGNLAQTLLDEAEKHGVTTIFLGTRALGVVGTLLNRQRVCHCRIARALLGGDQLRGHRTGI